MGYRRMSYHYVACVTGNSQGHDGFRIVDKWLDTESPAEAMMMGRTFAEAGGWDRVVAEKIFEHISMEH